MGIRQPINMRPSPMHRQRVQQILAAQFPGLTLSIPDLQVTVSGRTKRLRQVLDGSVALFSLRTSDSRLIPTFEGGVRLLASGYQANRVWVNDDAADYVSNGKSAFCKHVVQVDAGIRPGSEVLLLNIENQLLAVGTAQQPGYAMLQLQAGMAVRTKHSRND